METQIRNQFLQQHIDLRGEDGNSIVVKAAELCRRFALDAEDIVMKWMAFAHNNQLGSGTLPTVKLLEDIRQNLEKTHKKNRRSLTHETTAPTGAFDQNNIAGAFSDDFASAFGVDAEALGGVQESGIDPTKSNLRTPARSGRRQAPGGLAGLATPRSATAKDMVSPPRSAYSSRQKSGAIVERYPPTLNDSDMNTNGLKHPTELGIAAFEGPSSYRYMFQKLRDMSDVIDERIDVLGERITKRHGLLKTVDTDGNETSTNLSHVALPNQDEVVVVGRVCLDAAGGGKLNSNSVLLEGSRVTSNGARVALNLEAVPNFSIFPGQIVAAVGTNTTGTKFTPKTMFQGAAYPMMRTSPSTFLDHYFSGADDGVQVVDIMAVSGPYTVASDMSYAPLDDLLDVIKRETPDVVIFMGPFVDENHPMVKNAEVDVTYETLFEAIIEKITQSVTAISASTEMVFVPSLHDVHHDDVFPQPAFTLPTHLESERVHCFSNPATFMIKEITVGVSTTDTLWDLSKQETSRGLTDERMLRLANHVLDQRSFYPLLPPAEGVNLEYNQMSHVNLPKITPDIMLMPSRLKPIARNVNDCMVINPGQLTKVNSGGTYSRISVQAPRRNDIPEAESKIQNGLRDRTSVQVVRI